MLLPTLGPRAALSRATADSGVLTNVMSGQPARAVVNGLIREVGPISELAPNFPLAAVSGDFSPLWSGQAVALGPDLPAAELTKALAAEAQALLRRLAG